jgi:hypothetical protein
MRVLSLVVDLWKGRRQMEGGGGEASDVGSCFMSKPTWESIHMIKHASKFGYSHSSDPWFFGCCLASQVTTYLRHQRSKIVSRKAKWIMNFWTGEQLFFCQVQFTTNFRSFETKDSVLSLFEKTRRVFSRKQFIDPSKSNKNPHVFVADSLLIDKLRVFSNVKNPLSLFKKTQKSQMIWNL